MSVYHAETEHSCSGFQGGISDTESRTHPQHLTRGVILCPESRGPRTNFHSLDSARQAPEDSLPAHPQHLHWQKEQNDIFLHAGWPRCHQNVHTQCKLPSPGLWNPSAHRPSPWPALSCCRICTEHLAGIHLEQKPFGVLGADRFLSASW